MKKHRSDYPLTLSLKPLQKLLLQKEVKARTMVLRMEAQALL